MDYVVKLGRMPYIVSNKILGDSAFSSMSIPPRLCCMFLNRCGWLDLSTYRGTPQMPCTKVVDSYMLYIRCVYYSPLGGLFGYLSMSDKPLSPQG